MSALYTIYDRDDYVACMGNAKECQKFIGLRSLGSFYSTVSRQANAIRNRTNNGYKVIRLEHEDD